MTLLPETVRRIDTLVAQAQADGRAPSLVAGRRPRRRAGARRRRRRAPPPGCRPPVPDRLDQQDDDRRAGLQLRDEGRLALDDPLERHLPGTARGRAHRCANCSATPAACSANPTATGGSGPRASTWPPCSPGVDRREDRLPAAPRVPLLQPGVRTARRGARTAHRAAVVRPARRTGCSTRWACAAPRYQADRAVRPRLRRAPLARHAARGTPHRHRRDGPRRAALVDDRATWPAGPRSWPTPTRRCWPPTTLTEMCAPVVISDLDSWTGGHGLGLELYRDGDRVYVGHGGSMPGYVAAPAGAPAHPHRRWSASPTRTASAPAASPGSAGSC